MGRRKDSAPPVKQTKPRRQKQLNPQAREDQLIALAYDLVEERLLDGTATSQETTHFLRLGSSRERLEKELLKTRNETLIAKKELMDSYKRMEDMYKDAIQAVTSYRSSTAKVTYLEDEDA